MTLDKTSDQWLNPTARFWRLQGRHVLLHELVSCWMRGDFASFEEMLLVGICELVEENESLRKQLIDLINKQPAPIVVGLASPVEEK